MCLIARMECANLLDMNYLSNKCPKCHAGRIYGTFFKMNTSCSHCGHVYEVEQGYFTGAMFLDCMILPVSAIPPMIFFAYNGLILAGGIISLLQKIVLSPFVFHYTRLLWIHIGYGLDPSKK